MLGLQDRNARSAEGRAAFRGFTDASSDWIALGSVVVALVSRLLLNSSLEVSEKLSRTVQASRREIDLHNAWANVNDVDSRQSHYAYVVKALMLWNLTSALWLHDIIEAGILSSKLLGVIQEFV